MTTTRTTTTRTTMTTTAAAAKAPRIPPRRGRRGRSAASVAAALPAPPPLLLLLLSAVLLLLLRPADGFSPLVAPAAFRRPGSSAASAAAVRARASALSSSSGGSGSGASESSEAIGDGGDDDGDDDGAPVPAPAATANEDNLSASSTSTSSASSAASSSSFLFAEDYESYGRCLTPRQERDEIEREGREYAIVDADAEPRWRSALMYPLRRVRRAARGRMRRTGSGSAGSSSSSSSKPGALILLRCGESTWNANQTFTGWADPDLTSRGKTECEHAGRLLLAEGYEPDVVFTSRLKRAIHSVWTILREIDGVYLPVYKTWRLNERVYGALTGLSKMETARRLGSDAVQAWRNSLKARPPPLKETDPYHPGNDPRYSDLSEDQIPPTESLLDCMERARPLWEYKITTELRRGNNVLVVAHANTLRGLIKVIDGIGDEEIQGVSMPTAIPFVYRFDRDMTPLPPPDDGLTQDHASGVFLEKPGLLREALQRQEEWKTQVPGFGSDEEVRPRARRVTTLEESLLRLREEQEAERWVAERHAAGEVMEAGGAGGGGAKAAGASATPLRFTDDPSEFEDFDTEVGFVDDDASFFSANVQPLPAEEEEGAAPTAAAASTTTTGAAATKDQSASRKEEKKEEDSDPVVVLIRHGRTPHNNLGLFTGWEDPPLAPDGVEDARNAGRLLRRHGYRFDVCYTSWLTRAIETAWYVLDELDLMWVPLIKSWRLNERMYGALTGKSKKMIANIYGEDQLKKWRRGFTIQPPPTSSYSLSYPGNDYRRTRYVKDIRISLRETVFRSIEQRRIQVHRKFPKTESLRDCMDRSIPFYTERILREAVGRGKRVLITSHENAIRGILMHLCGIPPEAMNQLHLPNGLPLVYSVRGKCISLLDDGSGADPMEVHDFGPAAKYLFKPCELTDDFFDEMEKKAAESKEAVEA